MSRDSFTFSAHPGTDLWKFPPDTFRNNIPMERIQSGQLAHFESARISVTADWTVKYDQGGLLIRLRTSTTKPDQLIAKGESWLKIGVEMENGALHIGVVGCDTWADWSIQEYSGQEPVTVELARTKEGAWVYYLDKGKRVPIRQIGWLFSKQDGIDVDVMPLVARPSTEAKAPLVVSFQEFQVDWATH